MAARDQICSTCPELMQSIATASATATRVGDTLDRYIQTQDRVNELNRQEHEDFRESISELKGWKMWVLGVSAGVSTAVAILVTVLGFVIKVGAWPAAFYPREAEASASLPPEASTPSATITEPLVLFEDAYTAGDVDAFVVDHPSTSGNPLIF